MLFDNINEEQDRAMVKIYRKYINYIQREAYKETDMELNHAQVLKGMVAYFAQFYFREFKDMLAYAIYKQAGEKLG